MGINKSTVVAVAEFVYQNPDMKELFQSTYAKCKQADVEQVVAEIAQKEKETKALHEKLKSLGAQKHAFNRKRRQVGHKGGRKPSPQVTHNTNNIVQFLKSKPKSGKTAVMEALGLTGNEYTYCMNKLSAEGRVQRHGTKRAAVWTAVA